MRERRKRIVAGVETLLNWYLPIWGWFGSRILLDGWRAEDDEDEVVAVVDDVGWLLLLLLVLLLFWCEDEAGWWWSLLVGF